MRFLGPQAHALVRIVALIVLVSLGLTFPSIASVPAPVQAQSQGPRGGGPAGIPPGRSVHINMTSTPPVTTSNALPKTLPFHDRSGTALAPSSPRNSTAVQTLSSTLPQTVLPGIGTPSDVTMVRNSLPATNGQAGVTDDPAVVNVGKDLFYTGNFYAALSTNGGESWSYINPSTAFPDAYGGFCCDQQVIYVPGVNLVFWALLYLQDGTGNNEVRVAMTTGGSGLESGNWTYFDVTDNSPPPSCLIDPNGPNCPQVGSGIALDYPQVAFSANDFYLTANLGTNSDPYMESIIYRCPLSGLVVGQTANCDSFYAGTGFNGTDAFFPVNTTGTTEYWADHADYSDLAVWSWTEGQPWWNVNEQNVAHSTYPSSYTCPSPDGTDMCAAGEPSWSPIHGGWLNGSVLGFQWDAGTGQGGLGNFPYPYIHVVEINVPTMTLIDEPIIWSQNVAYAYGASAMNQSGGVALSIAYSGGGNYPGSALMIRDSVSSGAWEPVNVEEGTNGPEGGLHWGDYLSARPGSDGNSWLATTYVLQGACSGSLNFFSPCAQVQPRFLWFVRPAFAACVLPPTPSGSPGAPIGPIRLYLPVVAQGGCLP